VEVCNSLVMGVERKEDEIDIWQWGERINFWEIDL
jgi:hypothetical protein